jgi:histidinol phosphatase-like PHP family hydrolase
MPVMPRRDLHIHTKYLGCANATMEVPAIVQEAKRAGVTMLGITDHLNTLDRLERHLPIKRDILALETDIPVYFGVELNFLGPDAGFAYSVGIKEEYGFQFAIGGIHSVYLDTYDLKKIVDVQHRHHLATCRDPLVDVLVHPYWFNRGEFDPRGWPWFDSMKAVPESYVRELAQTAKETGTAIEINAGANLRRPIYGERYVNEYIAFLAILAEEGVCFSVGSDAHDIGELKSIQTAWQVADQLHLTPDRIWRPQGNPLAGPGARRR